MSEEALPAPRRVSRLGLYLPVAILAIVALGWSASWFYIRERVKSGLDEWIGKEASASRRWTCADRDIGGYPFRIEIRCADFTVDRGDLSASVGKLTVVAQVYRPRHVIAEASGPLRLKSGNAEANGTWKSLRTSVITAPGGFDLASLVAEEPKIALRDPHLGNFDVSSKQFEAHLRPDPSERTTIDIALNSQGAVIPGLDQLVGGTEPANIDILLTATKAVLLPRRPVIAEFEPWRAAGGRADLQKLTLAKGALRLEGTGNIAIDAEHRPEGQIEIQAAGLGGFLGQLASNNGGLLGALLGGGRKAQAAEAGEGKLRRLPPLQIQGGRLLVGPLPIPGLRIPRLY